MATFSLNTAAAIRGHHVYMYRVGNQALVALLI